MIFDILKEYFEYNQKLNDALYQSTYYMPLKMKDNEIGDPIFLKDYIVGFSSRENAENYLKDNEITDCVINIFDYESLIHYFPRTIGLDYNKEKKIFTLLF